MKPSTWRIHLVLLLAALLVPACGPSGGGGGAPGSEPPPDPPPPPTTHPNDQSAVGTNLSHIKDWSSAWPFVDIFKHHRAWIPQLVAGGPWTTGAAIDTDPLGNVRSLAPGQAVATLMCWDLLGHYPAGQYTCLYDGEGTITFGVAASISSQTPGRILVDVDPQLGGIILRITATNPANYVRNIRMVMPGFESTHATQPFHPAFLARIARYRFLRFMDWAETNNSPNEHWADRITPAHTRQATDQGVAVETMIGLANTLHADPWFCMPHLATDNYVTQFATLVKNTLDPTLRVYVEFSNETWNGLFGQAIYCQQQGLALGLNSNPYQAQLYFSSQRSVQIFNLWSAVFGGTDRLVRVLAVQSANPWTGTTQMDWQNAYQHADALAIAPYFGGTLGSPATQTNVAAMSVDALLDAVETTVPQTLSHAATHVANAAARGLSVITYEGGQHLVGTGGAENNTALTDLFIAANRHPRMRGIYLNYLNQWRAIGGHEFAIFSDCAHPSKWGSWGTWEYQNQDPATAYKELGVIDFMTANPRWW